MRSLLALCLVASACSVLSVSGDALGSLAIPSNADMTCMDVRGPDQYRSMSCPNANWKTYQWIQGQFVAPGIDLQLDKAFYWATGTRQCKRWYRDLMCRYVLPRCPTEGDPRKGGPCKSECESFSKSCPGLAMSCAAFDASPTECWTSTTQYAYGYDNAATSAARIGVAAAAVVGVAALAMVL